MKVYDYKKTTPILWCLVLCMSFFGLTLSAQDAPDMACASQVNISIGSDCLLDIEPGLFTEGAEDWLGVGTVTFSTKPPVSGLIGGEPIAIECGMYTFTVNASGNSCWGTVKIEDKLPPEPPVVYCLEGGQPSTGEPNSAENPCVSDCLSVDSDFYALLSANGYET
jgi:hypothetical protein